MTVDSEAIFALAAHSGTSRAALEELVGSMATAWLDERAPGTVFLARGIGRPLWLGEGRERGLLRLDEGRARAASSATRASGCASASSRRELPRAPRRRASRRSERFRPDRAYVEDDPLPAVRAPARGRVLPARASPRSPP